ncbi:hypothetical protein [Sphingobacterium griseoflavum]|uniref:Phage abortive infection protein n=1 Tax=Sphingobacterium griseoflavum TaxID=1474952 RepID=A0ABQ3I001_9SPHI|nr:hypothetical protein [Sphingobacterium griseoflavum]GHE44390.1 hypothetical protein GCM10017764_29490 [Sphingobacterium griseoflavum]
MNKEKKETPYYFKLNVLVWILIGSLFSLIGIGLSIFPVTDDVQGTNVANAIQFATLVFTVASFLYLIKNFQQQSEQIQEQRKDSEFNRAIDAIYQHTTYTKAKLDSIENRIDVFNELMDEYKTIIRELEEVTDDNHRSKLNKRLVEVMVKIDGRVINFNKDIRRFIKIYILLVYNELFEEDEIIILSSIVRDTFFQEIAQFYHSFKHHFERFASFKEECRQYYAERNPDRDAEQSTLIFVGGIFKNLKEIEAISMLFREEKSSTLKSEIQLIRRQFNIGIRR